MIIVSSLGLFATLVAASASIATQQTPAPGACSLLTKELALKVTSAANKKIFDLMPPQEEKLSGGTACEYGDIRIQILPGVTEPSGKSAAEWTAVPNVGDRAMYRANGREYAEMLVIVGKRTLTIQMGVPTGGTPERIKPNAITLANALVPKLK